MFRILIIDDEVHIRKLYFESFSSDGYDVHTCGSSHETMEALKTCQPDIVILDIELGDESGLDLLKQIRQARPSAAIVLNTAFVTYKSDFQTWLADAYIVKSSDLTDLKTAVKELVTGQRNEQSV